MRCAAVQPQSGFFFSLRRGGKETPEQQPGGAAGPYGVTRELPRNRKLLSSSSFSFSSACRARMCCLGAPVGRGTQGEAGLRMRSAAEGAGGGGCCVCACAGRGARRRVLGACSACAASASSRCWFKSSLASIMCLVIKAVYVN